MFIIDSEAFIRLGAFLGVLTAMAGWELRRPKRSLQTSKARRWFYNLAVTFLNAGTLRLLFPVTAVWVAMDARGRGLGLFNAVPLPELWAGVLSVLLLDLTIYAQHMVFHYVKPFWRLHVVHHTDLDIDVTTGARFHPLEIVLSMSIKMGAILALGAPPWSVVLFEVLLNATSMFNHSNVDIPLGADRLARLFVVTPDMHRVHHSVVRREMNSNFGFNLPWWDRLFGTYRAQPERGHQGMVIGHANFRDAERLKLRHILSLPFTAKRQYL
jgi:sterol desaturase/sphingolipid hydroxylase (fatty acid hydroxylase superfamily)